MAKTQTSSVSRRYPSVRRARLVAEAVQLAIVAAVTGILFLLGLAIYRGLARHGITFDLGFLWQSSRIDISEGRTLALEEGWATLREYRSSDTNLQALLVGLYNTLKVTVLGIVFSTLIGTLVGVGRLSRNWIVRQLCFLYVEFIRNTPLLIQIAFFYFAVLLQFPPLRQASVWYGGVIASRQGIYIPGLLANPASTPVSWGVAIAAAMGLLASLALRGPGRVRIVLGSGAALAVAVMLSNGSFPVVLDYPVAGRFSASGGWGMSPEMAAISLALVIYSSGFIAEIVRGAIQALPKGQWEAAASLGLSRRSTYLDIIIPQVFRIVLPALGNQYISLSKNTSLGIAIGFPDLFNVYGTISNQTGRMLEGIIVVVAAYLILSVVISAGVNYANRLLAKAGGPNQ